MVPNQRIYDRSCRFRRNLIEFKQSCFMHASSIRVHGRWTDRGKETCIRFVIIIRIRAYKNKRSSVVDLLQQPFRSGPGQRATKKKVGVKKTG